MATEVSVSDKDGDVNYYSTYAAARADIISSEIEFIHLFRYGLISMNK
ncbi:MAG: hypothetical protein IPM96_01550 [Ignavibacteria bacterium]|nr:hypothetical protein [Ignavibacteria bacterium]